MSLFGAATSGVDPQTGSYLSKEQRIAMFRQSQGRGGSGGGSGGGGGKKGVSPQSSIVVVNKMASTVQTLQTNFQETTGTVSNQVVENKSAIDGLYNLINAKRVAELKEEKQETESARLRGEGLLRGAREKLIEGLSSALSGLANAAKATAATVIKPVEGLFQRLMKVLGLLAAAWAIENLPKIIDNIEEWDLSLENLKSTFLSEGMKLRGVWSVLDRVLQPIKNLISRIARRALKVGRYIFRKAIEIGRKIFTKIGTFLKKLISKVVRGIKNVVVEGFKKIRNAFRPPTPPVQGPKLPPGSTSPDPAPPTPKGQTPPKKGGGFNPFNPKTWFGGAEPPASLPSEGQPKAGSPGAPPKASEPPLKGDAKKGAGAFKKFLQPLLVKFPKSIAKRILGLTDWAFRRIPLLGGAIDFALNKMSGQGDKEALFRAIGSSVIGAGGWVAGAKIGAGMGAAGGALFGGVGAIPGAAIGGLIGGILGSIGAGALGDQLGAWVYEKESGQVRTENEVTGSGAVEPLVNMITGETPPEAPGESPDSSGEAAPVKATIESPNGEMLHAPKEEFVKVPIRSFSANATNGSTSIAGLDPSEILGKSEINFMELPPLQSFVKSSADTTPSSGEKPQEVPSFSSSDDDMNYYRQFAAGEYQLL